MKLVIIDCAEIKDWDSFHSAFQTAFGFPSFYGRNMDAWIDCMTNLDTNFSAVEVEEGATVTLQLNNVTAFRISYPELYAAIIESAAFVNWRRIDIGEPPILLLSFHQ